MKRESQFQLDLIDELEEMFPGCIILKNDPDYIQGIPDLLVLFQNKWGALEVKKSAKEHHQPNQDYYVELMDNMSFASFIYPENKEEVLYELARALQSSRKTRTPRSK